MTSAFKLWYMVWDMVLAISNVLRWSNGDTEYNMLYVIALHTHSFAFFSLRYILIHNCGGGVPKFYNGSKYWCTYRCKSSTSHFHGNIDVWCVPPSVRWLSQSHTASDGSDRFSTHAFCSSLVTLLLTGFYTASSTTAAQVLTLCAYVDCCYCTDISLLTNKHLTMFRRLPCIDFVNVVFRIITLCLCL